ncbi:helix-turn-helix domain-containing protein [Lacticaseibacillus zhaodongensis]|uniref:helix-turn-helix domain-containing protein n=1 Tax=Lacticaseibacillus zhaodongensis TaxID=2668065 RepID=UPI0012D32B16|nr:helix-turn-helix domain-containing protein [Lacticaseibacillus zhaodongensis]
MKLVVNKQFGGFQLSPAAKIELAKRKHVYVNSVVVQYKHIFDRDTSTEIHDYDNHRYVVSGRLVTVVQAAGGDYLNEMEFKKKTSPVASKRQAVETMLKQGATHLAIARKLHMSPTTITRIAKETNMEVSR